MRGLHVHVLTCRQLLGEGTMAHPGERKQRTTKQPLCMCTCHDVIPLFSARAFFYFGYSSLSAPDVSTC